jgi:hypothetical protein
MYAVPISTQGRAGCSRTSCSAGGIAVEKRVQDGDRQHDCKPDLYDDYAVKICPTARANASVSGDHRPARFARRHPRLPRNLPVFRFAVGFLKLCDNGEASKLG